MEDISQETRWAKRALIWFIVLIMAVSAIYWFANRSVQVVDNGIIHYEEFQDLYNTCDKINTDLCNMSSLPENDKMFEQFSKAQRMNTLRTNLNRWVQDYNAKSNMWNRSLWKSKALPYQLDVKQFNCY